MANEVLSNVVFVLFPLLFYLVFLRQIEVSGQGKIKKYFLATMFIALILSILFPATSFAGYQHDLRLIPIIITFVYIGAWSGIYLVIFMLGLTALLSPSTVHMMIGNYFIISLILSLIAPHYQKFTLNKKILYISLLYSFVVLSRCLYYYSMYEYKHVYFSLYLSFVTWITLIAALLLIENREKQVMIQKELENTEKLHALSQLAASIAHEIRNPMTTVRGFLQLLTHSNSLTKKDVSFINLSIQELDRAQNIINDFLALSKPVKDLQQVFDLHQVIQDSINILSSYATLRNVRFDSDIDSTLYLNGYKNELQQVLINLMKNGIEAMNNGGILEIIAYKKKNINIIKIKDNGCGMSPEKLSKIGTPYYSTKEKGTGLGLMISYEIVRRMNGKIHVTSRPNVGTTFTLLFPVAKTEQDKSSIPVSTIQTSIEN